MLAFTDGESLGKILLVEDDDVLRHALSTGLRRRGFDVHDARRVDEALALFESVGPDAVVTDMRLPDGDVFALLPQFRSLDASVSIFVVSGYGSIDCAVRAVKEGASDFLTKPVEMDRLTSLLGPAIARRAKHLSARDAVAASARQVQPFRSRCASVLRLEEELVRLQDADCSVLVLGETGTGKSVLARRIHTVGARAAKPFVAINCAGLSRELVEAELFGHERGAFTGAHAAKAGLLDTANGGTMFLDEIGDIDVQVQPKLLTVLEEKRFRRIGDVRERSVDVRLVAATHQDLLEAVAAKTFRADLYYRISTVTLTVPPLRERRADIVPLAQSILDRVAARAELAPDAQRKLVDHDWPGNIRELKNVLERAIIAQRDGAIEADAVRFDAKRGSAPDAESGLRRKFDLEPRSAPISSSRWLAEEASGATRDDIEREHIRLALMAENGRVDAAARRLGMPRSTLYQKLKVYQLTLPRTKGKKASDGP